MDVSLARLHPHPMAHLYRRSVCTLAAMAGLLLADAARADVVGPCPPMFHASHQGCHFKPTPEGIVGAGVGLALVSGIVALIALRRKRSDGE